MCILQKIGKRRQGKTIEGSAYISPVVRGRSMLGMWRIAELTIKQNVSIFPHNMSNPADQSRGS